MYSQIFIRLFIDSFNMICWAHSCPGSDLVTQDNYELLSLIPLPCRLESRQKISGKLNHSYILFWMVFPSPLLFPLSILAPPLYPISGLRRWGDRTLDCFPTLGLNLGTVSDRTLAAKLWRVTLTRLIPSSHCYLLRALGAGRIPGTRDSVVNKLHVL